MTQEIFSLTNERVTLANLNVRGELHGDETVPAIDIKISFDSANNLLSKLDDGLRAAFFRKDDNRDLIESDHMPALRFPQMGAIAWGLEVPRAVLRIHGEEGDIVLGGGKAKKFKLDFKEGGTVNWTFTAQFSQPDEVAVAFLMGRLNQEITISLSSAEEEKAQDLFDQVEQASKAPKSAAVLAAEAEFSRPAVTPESIIYAQ